MEKQDTITTGLLLLVIAFIIMLIAVPSARHAIFPPQQIESCQHETTDPCYCVPCDNISGRRVLKNGVDFYTSNLGTELNLHLNESLKETDIIVLRYTFNLPYSIFMTEVPMYISTTAIVNRTTIGRGATSYVERVGSCCFPTYQIEVTQDTIKFNVWSAPQNTWISINPSNLEVMVL